jgi:hypothetical protein
MTRRGIELAGLVAAGLAAFFAVIGLLPVLPIASTAAPPALNSPETLVLTASDATYLSPVTLAEVSGARVEETDVMTPDNGAGTSSVAVWTVITSRYDTARHQQLEPVSRTFAIDKATAQLVSCCGASINGNLLVRQTGLSGYVFPAGTRKQAYNVFDTVLDRPEPAVYSGSGTIDGIPAYQYTEDITASGAGFSPLSATDPELYSARYTYWVDPETGALLAMSAAEHIYLAGPLSPATSPAATRLFDADLTTTPATVAGLTARDRALRHAISAARDVHLPFLVLAIASAGVAAYALSRRQSTPRPQRLRARHRHGKIAGGRPRKQLRNAALKMSSEKT